MFKFYFKKVNSIIKRSIRLFLILNQKFIIGLNKEKIKYFDLEFYKDKKILIIGGADTSVDYLSKLNLDDFNVIVRINKGHLILSNSKAMGTKTDVLYHCLNFDDNVGCGKIDTDKLMKQGLKHFIYPYTEDKFLHNLYNTLTQFDFVINRIRPNNQKQLLKNFPQRKFPTTGLRAISHVLASDFKELHITGFTFFKTPHVNGYNSITHQEVLNFISLGNNHDPELELAIFKKCFLHKKKYKSIFLDQFLENLVYQN